MMMMKRVGWLWVAVLPLLLAGCGPRPSFSAIFGGLGLALTPMRIADELAYSWEFSLTSNPEHNTLRHVPDMCDYREARVIFRLKLNQTPLARVLLRASSDTRIYQADLRQDGVYSIALDQMQGARGELIVGLQAIYGENRADFAVIDASNQLCAQVAAKRVEQVRRDWGISGTGMMIIPYHVVLAWDAPVDLDLSSRLEGQHISFLTTQTRNGRFFGDANRACARVATGQEEAIVWTLPATDADIRRHLDELTFAVHYYTACRHPADQPVLYRLAAVTFDPETKQRITLREVCGVIRPRQSHTYSLTFTPLPDVENTLPSVQDCPEHKARDIPPT